MVISVIGKCLQQLYYCTESRPVEKSAILKQPEQIQKEAAVNKNSLLSQLSLKITLLKQVTRRVTRHKRNHKTPSHDLVKTRVPKFYLKVLEALNQPVIGQLRKQ